MSWPAIYVQLFTINMEEIASQLLLHIHTYVYVVPIVC